MKKFTDLRKHPSLELALLFVFTYCPYVLAEGCHLSGIMAILFNGEAFVFQALDSTIVFPL